MKIKHYRAIILSGFLLLVLLSISLYSFFLIQKGVLRQAELVFNNQAEAVKSIVSSRINRDVYLLYSLRALYAASNSVERNEFQSFGDGFNIEKNFSGIYAIGFVQKVPASEKDSFAEGVKRDASIQEGGYPDYVFYPQREAENYYPLQYVYPADNPVEKIGYDFGSDVNLNATMRLALEKNTVVASNKILVDGEESPFYIIMAPIYQNGQPTDTLEQRQQNLEGYVGVMIKADKFFDNIVQTENINWEREDMYVYDNAPGEMANLDQYIYDLDKEQVEENKSEISPLSSELPLIVADKTWTMRFVATDNFGVSLMDEYLKWVFLAVGILSSLIIAFFVYYLLTSRRRALLAAEEITRELKENEEKFRLLFDESKDAIMTLTPEKGFLSGNKATIKLFGCKDEKDFTSKSPADLSPERQADGSLSLEKAKKMMESALEKGSNSFEWTHRRVDGTDFLASVLLSRVKKGKEVFLQATVRDITTQKQTEEKLKEHAIEMERINKLMAGRELKMIELKKEIMDLKNKNENQE